MANTKKKANAKKSTKKEKVKKNKKSPKEIFPMESVDKQTSPIQPIEE